MRTTLDLDDAVLAAVRAKARSENISLGRAASDLVRQGLAAGRIAHRAGFPVFQSPPSGHVITDDLVDRFRDDAGR
ncbi:DUF2191 domain-containing protein [Georgenia yuyongxinii]|uniref:DUF2191 domain-containing protein n=1 Tax=Georgenia yuyongxinii TaxID=2589797 RepID=A0A5B8C3I2_9MICO|nr:DUF2191 domain-containing protein [Georgenia yuyongxinii]QDC25163.1 DUF2191 domain-containing protein [Georgenia yuyongxinii]